MFYETQFANHVPLKTWAPKVTDKHWKQINIYKIKTGRFSGWNGEKKLLLFLRTTCVVSSQHLYKFSVKFLEKQSLCQLEKWDYCSENFFVTNCCQSGGREWRRKLEQKTYFGPCQISMMVLLCKKSHQTSQFHGLTVRQKILTAKLHLRQFFSFAFVVGYFRVFKNKNSPDWFLAISPMQIGKFRFDVWHALNSLSCIRCWFHSLRFVVFSKYQKEKFTFLVSLRYQGIYKRMLYMK